MSKVKKSIIVFVILLFTVSVYFTDQYIYSWTGWLAYQGGFCQSKLISLSAAKKDGFKSLPYPIDLAEITSKLTENPKYSVNSNEKTITISRNFEDFDYQIIFDKKTPENVYYRLSLNSKNSLEGEKCHTSNFEIYKKLTLLIDEIPLNDKARRMILSDLSIYYQNSAAT